MVRVRFLLAGPVRSQNVVPSFAVIIWHREATPHVINTILRHYVHFWIFWRESFEARKKRLAARGSGLKARKIASPQLQEQAQQQAALQNRRFNMLQQQINHS